MKIILACRALDQMAGGVEKQAVNIVNEMSRRGHEVHLFSWDEDNAQCFYELLPSVTWHKLNMGSPKQSAGWGGRLRRASSIRKLFGSIKPDVVLAFQHGIFISLRLYCLGLKIPFIAAERSAITRLSHTRAGKRKQMILQSFRLARCITVQIDEYIKDYPDYLRKKIVSIPNPVSVQREFSIPEGKDGEKRVLLSIGRLSYQKNYEVLLRAFAEVHKTHPDWVLRIVGEGEQRGELEVLRDHLGLSPAVVMFPGVTKDVCSEYMNAQLFCLSSRWEGFPNTLAEAASFGLPLVGFEGCSGVSDLIHARYNGLLAEGNSDENSLSSALAVLMSDPQMRQEMGRNSVKSVERYSPKMVYDAWEALLMQVAGEV